MTNTQLMQIFDALVASARTTMAAKNHDYTAASQDALANFKVIAGTLGLKPRQVWAVFFLKQVLAVVTWAKTGKLESEGLGGRFLDLVNFSALGQAVYESADDGPAWDFEALWADQSAWSQKTFGTDKERGPAGSLKHLIKEAQEALQKPDDPKEYADLIILVCDASRRAGLSMEALLKAAHAKMAENKKRTWPKPVEGEPCEHVKPGTSVKDDWAAAADPTPRPKNGLKWVGEPEPGFEEWGQATS